MCLIEPPSSGDNRAASHVEDAAQGVLAQNSIPNGDHAVGGSSSSRDAPTENESDEGGNVLASLLGYR